MYAEIFNRGNDTPFLSGKRNNNGELVIRKIAVKDVVITHLPSVLVSSLIITNGLINSPENPMYILFLALISFLLLFVILDLSLSKVTFTDQSIVLYGINGESSIDYKEIKIINYSQRGGGQISIQSETEKMTIRVKVRGFAEAIELLRDHVGDVLCEEIIIILSHKKRELRRG